MSNLLMTREAMLLEMGIRPLWQLKQPDSLKDSATYCNDSTAQPAFLLHPQKVQETVSFVTETSQTDWADLQNEVTSCHACVLCERRNQAVLGVGDLHPDWLFIGEAPGADEDAQGEPFVGQAGQLLDNMLLALGLRRGEGVYIANAVKCRPPGNRTPEHGEMIACRPYLEKQISWLKPKMIVLLGRAAVYAVLKEDKTLASLRQKTFEYLGIPVVVTYHPAYLLRNLVDKSKAWEDLVFARNCLSR
jgi:uracil-DNA glycosylase